VSGIFNMPWTRPMALLHFLRKVCCVYLSHLARVNPGALGPMASTLAIILPRTTIYTLVSQEIFYVTRISYFLFTRNTGQTQRIYLDMITLISQIINLLLTRRIIFWQATQIDAQIRHTISQKFSVDHFMNIYTELINISTKQNCSNAKELSCNREHDVNVSPADWLLLLLSLIEGRHSKRQGKKFSASFQTFNFTTLIRFNLSLNVQLKSLNRHH
jgi:hypothetical protein